jgi:pimeloyl-ACP methyl ester carboxylesterase
MTDWKDLQIRIHGESAHPALIYLPGLHGDWTLVSSFREAIRDQVRFVEFTYPRTVTWSLEDHARSILKALLANGIREGWVLAESFGSVLAWALLERAAASGFTVVGIVLAGGFVRYPFIPMVQLAAAINRAIPLWLIKAVCWVYSRYAVFRHRQAPETLRCINEFVRRRSEEADREAICWRYKLIVQSDARRAVQSVSVPIYQLCGFFDPIVGWWPVKRWLKRHCPSYGGWRVVWRADHNVLGTAPRVAAEQILTWIRSSSRGSPGQAQGETVVCTSN